MSRMYINLSGIWWHSGIFQNSFILSGLRRCPVGTDLPHPARITGFVSNQPPFCSCPATKTTDSGRFAPQSSVNGFLPTFSHFTQNPLTEALPPAPVTPIHVPKPCDPEPVDEAPRPCSVFTPLQYPNYNYHRNWHLLGTTFSEMILIFANFPMVF